MMNKILGRSFEERSGLSDDLAEDDIINKFIEINININLLIQGIPTLPLEIQLNYF